MIDGSRRAPYRLGIMSRPRPVVLLVEDNTETRDALCRLLGLRGYDPIGVRDGDEAWEWLRSEMPPDLIVLDLLLPGSLGGEDLAAALAAHPEFDRIPVVAYTAAPDGSRQHFDAFIRKGADSADALLETVAAFVPDVEPRR